jgi:hypothetical protein
VGQIPDRVEICHINHVDVSALEGAEMIAAGGLARGREIRARAQSWSAQTINVHVADWGEPGLVAPVVTTIRFERIRATGAFRNPGIHVRCVHFFVTGS